MRMRTLLAGIALWWSAVSLVAQTSLGDYTPLQCAGEIPATFLISASEKAQQAIAEDAGSEGEADKGKVSAETFLIESRFLTQELLHSGLVLFGDPVSAYIREVAGKVLADEPELFDRMQFYALRVPWVNAMATDEGVVFVTMGLMARVENEAQLASILAHEIAHYKKRHALNIFKEVEGIKQERDMRGFSRRARLSGMDLIKTLYHQQAETEADSLGMLMFARSGYDLDAAAATFDMLETSLQPWRQKEFKPAVFEDPTFRFPSWYVAKAKELELDIPQEVSLMDVLEEMARPKIITHPDADKRKAAMQRMRARLSGHDTDQLWQVSEERFGEVQRMARFELPRYYLRDEDFYDAIYHAWLLLEEHPDNLYLKKTIAQALYTLAKYRNAGLEYVYPPALESPVNGLANFFEHMEPQDFMLFVVRHLWKLKRKQPDDALIDQMARDALVELALHYEEFSPEQTAAPAELPKLLQEWRELEGPPGTMPRYSSLYKESLAKKKVSEIYPRIVLAAVKDDAFDAAWAEAVERARKLRARANYLSSTRGRRELAARWEKKRRKGVMLGIDKVLVVSPSYYWVHMRKVDGIPVFKRDYIASEQKRQWMLEQIDRFSKELGLEAVVIDPAMLTPEKVELFNELVTLNEWLNQQANFIDLTITPAYNQQEVLAIAEKYGVENMLHMTFARIDELRLWLLGAVLFELETGIPFDLSNYMNLKLSEPVEMQILYDLIAQLSFEPSE